MNEKRIPAGDVVAVRLRDFSGDLVVTTWVEHDILVVAGAESAFAVEGEELVLTCKGNCTLTLPTDLSLRFDKISGDVSVNDFTEAIEGAKIAGNLRLLQTGPASIAAVGGDVRSAGGAGDLQLGSVGGDLSVDSLTGNLRAGVGGDLRISSASGGIAAHAGGNAHLHYGSVSGGVQAVQAGGDIHCRLPAGVNATLNLQYGGSLRTQRQPSSRSGHLNRVVLGTGQTVMNFMAGGDITLDDGSEPTSSTVARGPEAGEEFAHQLEDSMRVVAGNLEAQLSAMASQLDAQLSGLGCGDEIAARVHERIQKAMARVEAKVEKALRQAERQAARAEKRATASNVRSQGHRRPSPKPTAQPRPPTVSDEERAAVLRMLEEGKVTVEQAELLLSAMET